MRFEKRAIPLLVAPIALAALAVRAGAQPPDPSRPEPAGKPADEVESLIATREFDRAEQLVESRLRGGADPAAAYFKIGKAYFDHQAWERSARFLAKSLASKRPNDEAHLLLGLDWRELHRSDDAEAEFLEAAKENPANSTNAYFAGHQLVLNGKFEAALPYLYKAIEWKPLRPQALRAVALAQAHVGNYGLAESYYRKAIDATEATSQQDYADLVDLGFLLLMGHDPATLEEGLKCAERAEKSEPNSAEAHYLAGKALFKLGRLREAIPELARGAKLNSEDSKPHFLLARIFDRLGRPDQARKEREALVRIQRHPGRSGVATGSLLPAARE